MWMEFTADMFEALFQTPPAGEVPADLLQALRDQEAKGVRRFWNSNADETWVETCRSITVSPYDHHTSPIAPLLWERYTGSRARGEEVTLLMAIIGREGAEPRLVLPEDDTFQYFHFLWYASAGYCEVLEATEACEDGEIVVYWCTDLADFFFQFFYEGPDRALEV